MLVATYYRLELHWSKAEKNSDDYCRLYGAYFSGPVLKHAQKIQGGDHIRLDLTPQYTKILTSYYFVDLSWGGVEYVDDRVVLSDVALKGQFVNEISNLQDGDFILIDTSKHEEEKHIFNLVYRGSVRTKDGKEYGDGPKES